ncbi:MAG: hypothetical protein QOE70_3605 [Chthoniobacter sp.]|jgi:hypothetical protein|nr:hypothetical protein [Chthoniobacter sp.]
MNATDCRIRDYFTALLVAVLFGSCTTTPQPGVHSPIQQRDDLVGHSLTAVSGRLGRPAIYSRTSRASELSGEFYSPINARFPLSDSASRRVFIREVRWQFGDHYIAVFGTRQGGKWVVFEAVEWQKDIVF